MQSATAPDQGPEDFDYELGDTVTLLWSGKSGLIIGRTEYVHQDNKYLIQYVNDVGDLVSHWFHDDVFAYPGARH